MKRRDLLFGAGAATLALPFVRLLRPARAFTPENRARRLIVFYWPDGVPGNSAEGELTKWHAHGGETSFTLPDLLSPLAPYRDDCIFFRGLSLGPTDAGSHPGGAKKLLTAVDGGNGVSLDRHLAGRVGADRPHRMIYLGAQANHNGASGDKHISYVAGGQTAAPEDNPIRAFEDLFGSGTIGGGGEDEVGDPRAATVIDAAKADLDELRARLGQTEKTKLDLHLESLREIEARVTGGGGSGGGASCDEPSLAGGGIDTGNLYAPEQFPAILRAQIDVAVQATACDLTRIAVIQGSHHTSELIMSRFPNTDMHDPGFDMRSHQASHYGARHDFGKREFADFVLQRKWWMEQLAYLLESLRQRPEGDGTMLDYSIVLACSEVCDGNTHGHDDMPFIVAGGGAGRLRTGRLLDLGYRRHSDLLHSLALAMGDDIGGFGQASGGPIGQMLT